MMDLGLGPDIYAARWFIDNQDRALAGQPLGEGELLLVAAAEGGNGRIHGRCFHTEPLDVLARKGTLRFAPDESGSRKPGKDRQRSVLPAIHREHQTEPLAVLRQQAD